MGYYYLSIGQILTLITAANNNSGSFALITPANNNSGNLVVVKFADNNSGSLISSYSLIIAVAQLSLIIAVAQLLSQSLIIIVVIAYFVTFANNNSGCVSCYQKQLQPVGIYIALGDQFISLTLASIVILPCLGDYYDGCLIIMGKSSYSIIIMIMMMMVWCSVQID